MRCPDGSSNLGINLVVPEEKTPVNGQYNPDQEEELQFDQTSPPDDINGNPNNNINHFKNNNSNPIDIETKKASQALTSRLL